MNKVYQTKIHDEDRKICGNCLAACLSSIMEFPLEYIPVFEEMDIDWVSEMIAFLWEHGWEFDTYIDEDQLIIESENDYYIVGGTSPRNSKINHAVIYRNKKLIHDPHPDGTGILNKKFFWYLYKV